MRFILLCTWVFVFNVHATGANQTPESIATRELQHYNDNSQEVKKIINFGLYLAGKNLGYQYGSADPKLGGMDCSGTVFYILNSFGVSGVPRSSDLQYEWVRQKGHYYPVSSKQWGSADFSHLRPGDLLFWNGTYDIKRAINVTHVMIYIGKNKAGEPLMVGASNGRTYKGRKIYGVSVFDFQLPAEESSSHFLGYSCIPQVNC